RYLFSNIDRNTRDKEVPFPLHCPGDVPQAIFCFQWFHMAKEVARHHHILRSDNAYQFGITYIVEVPANSFSHPRSDLRLAPVSLKHFPKLRLRHPLEYRRAYEITNLTSVNCVLRDLQHLS